MRGLVGFKQVPMLFFRGYLSDGRELDWGPLVHDLPASSRRHLADDSSTQKWASFLTREDHPHLRRPFYGLHPCQTAALLALMLSSGVDPGS
jgi:ubiquitin-like-conjugating enzyme ATG10